MRWRSSDSPSHKYLTAGIRLLIPRKNIGGKITSQRRLCQVDVYGSAQRRDSFPFYLLISMHLLILACCYIFAACCLQRTKYGQVMKSTTLRLPDAFASRPLRRTPPRSGFCLSPDGSNRNASCRRFYGSPFSSSRGPRLVQHQCGSPSNPPALAVSTQPLT